MISRYIERLLVISWPVVEIAFGYYRDAGSVYVAELGSDVAFQRGQGPKELSTFVPDIGHRIVVCKQCNTAFDPLLS